MPTDSSEPDWPKLWTLAANGFILGSHSLHGPDHWRRVERNGLEIVADNDADEIVVRLFAVLHDSQRINESHDPQHGLRAANWARQLRGEHFKLSNNRFDLLVEACIWHDKGQTTPDPTIGACWDADRLDLTRCGIQPVAKLMSTALGKKRAVLGSPPTKD